MAYVLRVLYGALFVPLFGVDTVWWIIGLLLLFLNHLYWDEVVFFVFPYWRRRSERIRAEQLGEAVQLYIEMNVEQSSHARQFTYDCLKAFNSDEKAQGCYEAQQVQAGNRGPITYFQKLVGRDIMKGIGDIFLMPYLRHVRLPDYTTDDPIFTARYQDFITSSEPIHKFFNALKREDRLMWTPYSRYVQNSIACDVAVKEGLYKKDSVKYLRRLVKNTGFDRTFDPDLSVGVKIPDHLWYEGVWAVAPTGQGKSTLLAKLLGPAVQDAVCGRASVIVMDSKGELTNDVKRLKVFAPGSEDAERLVLIEPGANLALNPLNLGTSAENTLALANYIFGALLGAEMTAKQRGLFNHVYTAMQVIPGANFQTFMRFLRDWKPYAEHLKSLDPDELEFFESGTYDSREYKDTRQKELYWRIDTMMGEVPLLKSMFKAPKTLVDIEAAMDAGKAIVIDNSEKVLQGGTELFSRFFIALILAAAQRRSGREDSEKLPVRIFIDECDVVIAKDDKIAQMLTKTRSQKIALILAHQNLAQLKNPDVLAAVQDCGVRFANPDKEAPSLAADFRTDADTLRNLERGQFALFMRTQPSMKKPLIINVPNHPSKNWKKMSDAEFKEVQKNMAAKYSYIPQQAGAKSSHQQKPYEEPEPGNDNPSDWE